MNFELIVAAAGKGTRLGINNAKCLVEIAGEPIINYIIRDYITFFKLNYSIFESDRIKQRAK